MDDDGAGDDSNLLSLGLHRTHHLRDSVDGSFDTPFRRNLVRHERKPVSIAILERRHDADAFDAADDRVAFLHVAQLPAGGAAAVDDDDGVHALIGDQRPLAAFADMRLVVRRRIEIFRRAAVQIRDPRRRVLPAGDKTPERHEVFDDGANRVFRVGGDAHPQHRRLVVALADREADHFERGVVPDDGVEDAVQNAGVDQVSRRFDNFRGHV